MPRKLRRCFDCDLPARGFRCQKCASAYGTKNGTGLVPVPKGNGHLFPFVAGKQKYLPAEETWWDKVPRSEWQGAYMRESARIEKGVCANYRPTAMPSEWM
jgi:hypothetical protein